MPEVLILTGPPSAGKSSAAQALAERYDRVAHVEVDLLRHFITPTGYIRPGRPGFERQEALATRNACAIALNFLAERFAVIIDDVIVTGTELSAYFDGLKAGGEALHVVRLLPPLAVCLARNQARSEGRISPQRIAAAHTEMSAALNFPGVTLDNGSLSAHETADRLQALTTSGRSIVQPIARR